MQNAIEVRPPVVKLRSRCAGVGRRGPVVTLFGWASVLGPAGEPARGRDWPWLYRILAQRGWWAEGHGGLRGNRVPSHGGFVELESTRSPDCGRPRGGHARPPGSCKGPLNRSNGPEPHGGLDPERVSGYGSPACVEARFIFLLKAWMGPRGGKAGGRRWFGPRVVVLAGLLCLVMTDAIQGGGKMREVCRGRVDSLAWPGAGLGFDWLGRGALGHAPGMVGWHALRAGLGDRARPRQKPAVLSLSLSRLVVVRSVRLVLQAKTTDGGKREV